MATGAIIARILTQYSDKGSKAAARDISKLGKSFDAFGKKAARAFGLAALASAAFAVKVGKDAVDAAISDQKSQAILANSLRNTTGATDAAIAGVETYITALQKQFSVVDDDLRPAMAALTAVTGSVTAAQTLMQTALDVSANSGADLASSVDAIVKATRGQYKGLANLVKGLDSGTLATKDFGKIMDKVSQITGGAAATRAQTLEYRLMGLKIAYSEVLETLGYALLPVIEQFVFVVTTKVLPLIETWIAANKDKLAASFQVAANFAVQFLTVAIAIGNWISNNMTSVKVMAALIAGMFAVNGIAKFILLIDAAVKAMAILRATALGAAIATAFATGGVSLGAAAAGLAAAGLATVGLAYVKRQMDGNTAKTSTKGTGSAGKLDTTNLTTGAVIPSTTDAAYAAFIKSLNNNTAATTKDTKAKMDAITKEAVRLNLERQKALSGSTALAIGQGSKLYKPNSGVNVVVNNAGSVISNENLVQSIVNGVQRTTRRNFGDRALVDLG